MSCNIKNGDKIFLFDNGQYFVDGIGFMSMETLMKCEFEQGYKLDIQKNTNSQLPNISSQPKNQNNLVQAIQSIPTDPTGFTPQDAIQMGSGNVWLTVLLLAFSFFGGGKLSKFLEIKDNNSAKLDELTESIKEIKADIKQNQKDIDQKHDEIDKNLDRLAMAIKEIQSQVDRVDKNNQKLLQKYEILLSDDIPDLDEIMIRIQKMEKQYKELLVSTDVTISSKKTKTLVIDEEKKLNDTQQEPKPKPTRNKSRVKNNANSV